MTKPIKFPKAGNHLLIGLRPTTSLDPLDEQLLRTMQPAGVILFKDNFDHEAAYPEFIARLHQLLSQVRAAIGRPRIFVGIDHEGGRVFRVPPHFTNFGYARQWSPFAGRVGSAYGAELSSLGVNLNFAPVLDVDSNPANPVIGARSLGKTPDAVADAAMAFIAAQNTHGVQSCGKHFPGHGDAETDSHYALPVIQADAATLAARELPPFVRAIKGKLGMMMSAHLMVPALDPEYPATASSRIVHDLLRVRLGFEGVITTDDLGMHAVQSRLSDGDFVVRIANAGHDLFMMCAAFISTDQLYAFTSHIDQALSDGRIDHQAWGRSGERIDAMLARCAQDMPRIGDALMFERHQVLLNDIAHLQQRAT